MTPEDKQGLNTAMQRYAPPSSPYEAVQPEATFFEGMGAMARTESLSVNLFRYLAPDNTPSMEEWEAAIAGGFNAPKITETFIAQQEARPDWADDEDALIRMSSSRTPSEWERSRKYLDDLWRDRAIIQRQGLATNLMQSIGVGIFDPSSIILGLATGGTLQAANAARMGAGAAYANISRRAAHIQRYIPKKDPASLTARGLSRLEKDREKIRLLNKETADLADSIRVSAVTQATTQATLESGWIEGMAHSTQEGRTAEETIYNIFGSVALSGLMAKGGQMYNVYIPAWGRRAIAKVEKDAARRGFNTVSDGSDSVSPHGGAEDTELEISTGETRNAGQDRSPVYDEALRDGMLPADRLVELEAQYLAGDAPDVAGYLKARDKASREYLGPVASGAMSLLRALHPSLRLKTNKLESYRIIGGLLTESDYVEAGVHTNGRTRNVRAVETMIKLDERQTGVLTSRIFKEGELTVRAAAASRGLTNFDAPSLFQEGLRNVTGRHALRANTYDMARSLEFEVYKYLADINYGAKGGLQPIPQFRGLEPEIKAIGDRLHKEILEPFEASQLDAKMLNKAMVPEGSRHYFHRVYDIDEIDHNPVRFLEIMDRHFFEDRVNTYLKKLNRKAEQKAKDLGEPELPPPLTRAGISAKKQAQLQRWSKKDSVDFMESVRADSLNVAPIERAGADISSLKLRTPIPTSKVIDFVKKDTRSLLQSWVRDLAPEIHLRKTFGTSDYTKKLQKQVDDEVTQRLLSLDELSSRVGGDTAQLKAIERERRALQKAAKRGKKDVEGIVDVLRNTYGIPKDPSSKLNAAGKILRAINFTTKLGGMTISSLTDPAYLIMKTGWGPATKALLNGRMGAYNKLASGYRSAGTEAFVEFRNDAHMLGIVAELEVHSRMEATTMQQDLDELRSKLDFGLNMANNTFSRLSFMNRWNDWVKSVSHMAYTQKIHSELKSGNIDKLRDLGIDEEMAQKISYQWLTKGKQIGDIEAPNMRNWHLTKNGGFDADGREAQELMSAALVRLVDSTIVTPGAGDVPLLIRSPVGKLIGQFQTFPIAVLNRVMLPAAQQMSVGDFHSVSGLVFAIGAGAGVYALKEVSGGREVSEDFDVWMYEGIERSGVFGVYATGFTLADELVDGRMTKALFGDDFEGGFRSRDPIIDALSVSVRTLQDGEAAIRGVSDMILGGDEDMSWGQGSAMRRLMPGNNLFYLKQLSLMAQDSLMKADRPK